MASELQQQVLRHREKHLLSAPIHKGRPSLFLSPKDAAAVDVADIYETAMTGLRALTQYESRFQPFYRTLFLESSKDLQRELKTATENDELDQLISDFLKLLSPYASEHAAHTVLEYLIRRYRINEMNADALIRCLLPFHDTKIFAKVAELAIITGTMWAFLEGVKQSGSPLPRAVLTKFVRKNPSLLSALTVIARSALVTGSAGSASNTLLTAGVNRIVSFYTAVMVELCDNKALEDAQLRIVYPYLVDGIKAQLPNAARGDMNLQWSRSSCIVLSQLARTTRLATPFVDGVVSAMFARLATEASEVVRDGEACTDNLIKGFVMLTQLQKVVLSSKAVDIILNNSLVAFFKIVDALVALSSTFDLEAAYESIFCGLVQCLIAAEKSDNASETYPGAVNHFLCSGVLPDRLVALCVDQIVAHALDMMNVSKNKKSHKLKHLGPIIQILLQRYPEVFNSSISSLQGSKGTEEAEQLQKKLWQLLRQAAKLENTLYSRGASENGTSLLLSLNHPSPEIRAAAVDTFDEVVTEDVLAEPSADLVGLAEAVLNNLAGSDDSVCTRGWNENVIAKLVKIVAPERMISCIVTAFKHWLDIAIRKPKKEGRNVFNLILGTLKNDNIIKTLCAVKVGQCADIDSSFGVWLSANLLSLCNLEEETTSIAALNGADEDKIKKIRKRYATLQTDALETIQALGSTIPILNIGDAEDISFDGFVESVSSSVSQLISDRDASVDETIKFIGALAQETISEFVKSNEDYFPDMQRRSYVSMLTLLKNTCISVAALESNPAEVPPIRSYFLCLHEIFSSILAVVIPVELTVDFNSPVSHSLRELYTEYVSTDFSMVLKTEASSSASEEGSLSPFSTKFLLCGNSDATLLLFFLSASTTHSEIATLLGPLLMSGLVPKEASSTFDLVQLLSEVVVAPVHPNNRSVFQGSSAVLSGENNFSLSFLDPTVESAHSMVCSDMFITNTDNRTVLNVSTEAKIAASQALCSIVPLINLNDNTGVEEMTRTVAIITPLVVYLLSEQQAELRRAGLFICRNLLAFFEDCGDRVKFSLSFSQKAGVFVKSVDFSAETVVLMCGVFIKGAEVIVQDPAKVTQMISENIFGNESSELSSLKTLLLSAAVTFGWMYPSVSSSVFRAVLMSFDCSTIMIESAWPYVKSLLLHEGDHHVSATESADTLFLSELSLRCLNYTSGRLTAKGAKKIESDSVQTVIEIIGTTTDNIVQAPLLQWMSLSGPNSGSEWSSKLSDENKLLVFRALLEKSLACPGSSDIITALSLMPISMETIVEELLSHKKAIADAVKSGDFGFLDESSDIVTYTNAGSVSGDVASCLQVFYNALDSMSPLVRALGEKIDSQTATSFGSAVVVLFDILDILLNPKLTTLVVVEYCKGVVLDSIQYIFSAFSSNSTELRASTVTKTPTKRSRQRNGSSDLDNALLLGGSYPESRMNADTDCLFKVLQTSKLHHTQGSVLTVLNSMMKLSPRIVSSHAISTLSEILSKATLHAHSGENSNSLAVSADNTASLLRSVLFTLTKFIETTTSSNESADAFQTWGPVIHPLFAYFQSVTHLRRISLVKIATDVLGELCLSSCASALLSHAYVSFCTEESKSLNAKQVEDMDIVDDENDAGEPKIFTAVISRAADKKANRQVVVSPPQEIYQLALDTFLSSGNPVVQTSTLVSLLKSATGLFDYGLNNFSQVATEDDVHASYAASLLQDFREFNSVSDPIKIAVLHLQFVYSVLENGVYHKLLAPHVDGWDLMDVVVDKSVDTSKLPQEYFVELCEIALKFLASSMNAQQMEKRTKGISHGVSITTMSKEAWKYCVDIIESLQRLLDGPTFLGVLQELLCHEQLAVRQKALQILATRLEQLSSERDDVESSLYVGLIQRIKESVESAVSLFIDKKALSKVDRSAKTSHIVGLAQSGAMCIELLARHINHDSDSSWYPEFQNCLEVQLVLIDHVTESTATYTKNVVQKDDPIYAELVRLQGSLLLCSVTLCSVLGARVLPKLSGLLQYIFQNIRSHYNALLSDAAGSQNSAATVVTSKKKKQKAVDAITVTPPSTNRSRVLLLRSAVSAIAALAAAMPNFMHPYIEESIVLSLSIARIDFGASGISIGGTVEESGSMLGKDVYKSMVIMIASIPPRLCIPRLLTTSQNFSELIKDIDEKETSGLLIVLIRYVELLADYWGILDRSAIASNIATLGPLMIDLMGYRFNSQIQSDLSRTLENKVANACVQLCMKLTEAEVRAFLVHAAEWIGSSGDDSDSDSDDDEKSALDTNWLKNAKSVSYFHCVAALNDKMRGVFTSSMGCIWDITSEKLAGVVKILKSGSLSVPKARDSEKVSKKRKEINDEDQEERLQSIQELLLLGTDILNSIRSCCLYDKIEFIDEERYDLVIANVVALLGSRKWFEDDQKYESFCVETVIPCCAALAVSIGKDTLWKPMNHAILLMMRDKKRVVRVVCIKALHKLFTNVGEEYLILLPECLPFLSELLEDSNTAVTAAAAELVRYIEDISGESLDNYLQ